MEGSKHEQDGGVIIAEFESYLVMNTYAPNNGWKEEENSFPRRRKWDNRILEFVQCIDKPLIWCGDLNASHEDIDVSHLDFFSRARQLPWDQMCEVIINWLGVAEYYPSEKVLHFVQCSSG